MNPLKRKRNETKRTHNRRVKTIRFNFRHQFTNDSVLMSGDLKKLNELIDNL